MKKKLKQSKKNQKYLFRQPFSPSVDFASHLVQVSTTGKIYSDFISSFNFFFFNLFVEFNSLVHYVVYGNDMKDSPIYFDPSGNDETIVSSTLSEEKEYDESAWATSTPTTIRNRNNVSEGRI